MHWLQRFFAPQSRPFIIYVPLLLVLLAGAHWYKGRFKQRMLAQLAASVHEVVADKDEIAKRKMERTSLEFQLVNLRNTPPILTNAALSNDWSAAALLSQLDPEVCASWRAYLEQISPLLKEKDPNLEAFLALQVSYVSTVEPITKNPFQKNKASLLMNLRAKDFFTLFNYQQYVADAVRVEALAQTLADDQTLALRKAYEGALTASATNLNPKLTEYASARLRLVLKSDELRGHIRQLSEELGDVPASPPLPPQQAEPDTITRTAGSLLRPSWLETCVPQEKDFLGILLATALVGFLFTQPVEMRDRRWLKIGASVVLVYLGLLALRIPVSLTASNRGTNVFAFCGFLVPAALLAAVWASSFAGVLSNLFLQLIDPAGAEETEDTRLRPAYEAARQGQYRLALKLLKPKLLLDPWHYEALVLKARLHRQLNRKWRARWTLAKVLRNRHLSASQRETADYMRRNLGNKSDPCWSLVKRAVPRQQFEELLDI